MRDDVGCGAFVAISPSRSTQQSFVFRLRTLVREKRLNFTILARKVKTAIVCVKRRAQNVDAGLYLRYPHRLIQGKRCTDCDLSGAELTHPPSFHFTPNNFATGRIGDSGRAHVICTVNEPTSMRRWSNCGSIDFRLLLLPDLKYANRLCPHCIHSPLLQYHFPC